MINKIIIEEFEKLVIFINDTINKLKEGKNIKDITTNEFRLKQIKNVLLILKKYPIQITLDNYTELNELSGIGKGSISRIKEILEKGSLSEISNIDNKKNKSLDNLESVVGIGPNTALELYNKGIKNVNQLITKIKKGEIKVNDKIMIGLKYYGKFEDNIPRNEITKINKLIKSIIDKINKTIDFKEHFIFEIAGSYRREKDTSGDIDILISKKSNVNKNYNYLEYIINLLKLPIKKNNNNPLLIDDLTDFGKTKYMGFCKYLENPPRRIDIRFITFDCWFTALLYFTGSVELNKKMRQIAKTKKLKLSEYGLFKENGEQILINSEHEIFDILEMEYLIPKLR